MTLKTSCKKYEFTFKRIKLYKNTWILFFTSQDDLKECLKVIQKKTLVYDYEDASRITKKFKYWSNMDELTIEARLGVYEE